MYSFEIHWTLCLKTEHTAITDLCILRFLLLWWMCLGFFCLVWVTLPNITYVPLRELTLCCCVWFWWEDNRKWLTPVLVTSAQILPPLTLLQVEEVPWDFGSSAFPVRPSGAVGRLLELVTAAEPLPQGDHGHGFTFPIFSTSLSFSVSISCWICELKSARVGLIALNSGTLTDEPAHQSQNQALICWERLGAKGEEGNRGWDGWMASPTQWT